MSADLAAAELLSVASTDFRFLRPLWLLGLLVHNVFVVLLAGLVSAELPPPGPWPGTTAAGYTRTTSGRWSAAP